MSLVPILQNILYDNFASPLFNLTSSPVINPKLSLPTNITQSFFNGASLSTGAASYLSFPIQSSSTYIDIVEYLFDYPIDLTFILNNQNYNSSNDDQKIGFYIYIAHENTGPNNESFSQSFSLDFRDVDNNLYPVQTPLMNFSLNASSTTDKARYFFSIFSPPPSNFISNKIRSIRIKYFTPSSPIATVNTRIYFVGYQNYSRKTIPGSEILLFDNFTHTVLLNNPGSVIQTASDGSWGYIHSSPFHSRVIKGTTLSSGDFISIFTNGTSSLNVNIDSPAGACILTGLSSANLRDCAIEYSLDTSTATSPSNISGCLVYIVKKIDGTNYKVRVSIEDILSGNILAYREEFPPNSSSNIDTEIDKVQYITFSTTSHITGGIRIHLEEQQDGFSSPVSFGFQIYLLYFQIIENPSIKIPSNFFLDTFMHTQFGGTYDANNNSATDAYGLYPKNVTKTLGSSGIVTISEDSHSLLVDNITNNASFNIQAVSYKFSPTASLQAIRRFYLYATGQHNLPNILPLNVVFTIIVTGSSGTINYQSNPVILNIHSGQLTKVFLETTSSYNTFSTVLSSVSTITLFVTTQQIISTTASIRVYLLACEYECNIIPFFDNFSLLQGPISNTDSKISLLTDRSFNYPGHPERTLLVPNITNGTIRHSVYTGFSGNITSTNPPEKHYLVSFSNSDPSQLSSSIRFSSLCLKRNFKYDIITAILKPSSVNFDSNSININIFDTNTSVPLFSQSFAINPIETIIQIDPVVTGSIDFNLNAIVQSTGQGNFYIPFMIFEIIPTACVLEDTRITLADGTLKRIQEVKRGDIILTPEGPKPVCRVIKERLSERVGFIMVPKGAIDGKIPYNDLYVCSRHIVKHQGYRRLAGTLLVYKGSKFLYGNRRQITNKEFMYDLQFEVETYYYTEGVLSQSRSPYLIIDPLPKQLYFNPDLYKTIRVPNALLDEKEPVLSTWPNVYQKFCWKTFLALYIIKNPNSNLGLKDFNETTAKALYVKNPIELNELIPEDFDWKEYIRVHVDLRESVRNELDACIHWLKYGYKEFRYYRKYPYL